MKPHRLLILGAAIAAGLTPATIQAQSPTTSAPPVIAATPRLQPPPPTPLTFDDALLKAANDLFANSQVPAADVARAVLAIDPLIDGVTGAQSTATRSMERRIADLVRNSYPKFEVQPFTTATISHQPVVLIGTFTAINNAGTAGGPRDAYRICLALIDIRTRKVVSKGVARAKPEGIDVTPTAFYADVPVWGRDAATDGYIKTCQATKLGEAIDKGYADRILASALITDAIQAYDGRRYSEALSFYEAAQRTPGGDQLRTLNGVYLANWKLGRTKQAAEAFGHVVDFGLANQRLSVRFLFRPGSTSFLTDRRIAAPYTMWLNQIATRATENNSCLEIVGHTSATGPEPLNLRLSALRAEQMRDQLRSQSPKLDGRLIATGVGSRETLVGTGRDNASDALDRRVEFKIISDCQPPQTKL